MSPAQASPALASLTVSVTVIRGRNLIAKDRNLLGKRTTSDVYATIHVGRKRIGRTTTKPKTVDPVWDDYNGETFRHQFGADEARTILRGGGEVALTIRLFDEDKASSDDCMGTVVLPVDARTDGSARWFPVGKGTGQFHCKNAKGDLKLRVDVSGQQMRDVPKGMFHVIPAEHSRITVGLAWDVEKGVGAVDLDSSVVAVGRTGAVLLDECVYYGNLSNSNSSIVHSGDEMSGEALGDDEKVFVELDRVPPAVVALYFLLTVSTPDKTFSDVRSARARFVSTETKIGICRFVPSDIGRDDTAIFLVRIARDPSTSGRRWALTPIEEGNQVARDFGSLVPEIKGYTRDLVPDINIDPTERVAIMRKGGTIRVSDYLPGRALPSLVTFGLAWDMTNGKNIDLDASVLMLDDNLNQVDIVYYGKLTSTDGSVRHCGDEREGDEIGDDEKINISLSEVDGNVKFLGFVVNSFSGQELDDVARASCHLFDPKTHAEIAKYSMTNTAALDKHTALVMGCLYREGPGEWHLTIISEPAQGRTAHENVDELQNYLRRNPPGVPLAVPEPETVVTVMPEAIPMEEDIVFVPQSDLRQYAP